MASSSWPPSLKAYVNETFAKCTDQNRAAVESELKGLIFKAFEKNELWTIDWPKVKLESLNPPNKRKAFVPSTPHSYGVTHSATLDEDDRREKRAKRFVGQNGAGSLAGRLGGGGGGGGYSRVAQGGSSSGWGSGGMTPEPDGTYDPNVIDWDRQTIVGTSTKLEKPFLRLTSVPDPATIRPLGVLKLTLELLKKKWRQENNYGYICDQFKSMRQDLTVQRIKNDFTCTVYEIHARIALEKGDLGEFNQCQGQLRHLYKHGLHGHVMEFLGYRILYLLFSQNRAELNSTLADLTETETQDASVSHALAVRLAASQGNYAKFFRLFNAAPKMGGYLMDHFVPRERVKALVTMTKAYQQLPLSFIVSQLAFDTPVEAIDFLQLHQAASFKPGSTSDDAKQLDCKVAHVKLNVALDQFKKVDIKGQI